MDFDQLLNALKTRGLVPRVDSYGRLALAGPLERIDETLRQALRQHRPRLVALCIGQGALSVLRGQGDGAPLVLLPGLASQPQVFAGLAAAADWRRPLYGVAYPPPGTAPTLEALVGALAQRLAPLFRAPFHLGGHSFGGLVAAALTERLTALGTPPQSLVLFDVRPPCAADFGDRALHTAAFFLERLAALGLERPSLQPGDVDLLERALDPRSWPDGLPKGFDRVGLNELWARCVEGQRQFLEFRAAAPPARIFAVIAGRVPASSPALLYQQQAQILRLDSDHDGVLALAEAERVASWLESLLD